MTKRNEKYHSFKIAVPKDFEEVISHFYYAENKSEEPLTQTLLPSYQTILVFNFGSKALLHSKQNTTIEVDKCLVLGPIKKAFDYSLQPQSKILVANFKNDAFYRFFRNTPIGEKEPLDPDSLFKENCFTALWYELNEFSEVNLQVKHLLEYCNVFLKPRNPIAEQLSNFKEAHLNPIKTVASNNNLTERIIQINQKKHFGYSAKEISRYRRFLNAIELLENFATKPSKKDWFAIISECGYYDQSQLINDFKHYINLSPTKYFKFQQEICNPTK
ncbi:helix-turn-helix domain-containing protein [Cyclobacterium qasimii]|uniref:HTH araC/xylS-type domain-containing protein n=2 Tax=Cyclobacterium qasimii TaxID=1350429 RepID=S7VBU8_9BACT|nr:helix-turn-helix domain-containing protein [Cyclobacterium qasimii]EPR67685.1 hypothetical protein ADICYQ_3325 [Cyclobacterium qasimii M12-11B]GEO19508.1 hypothetical protein CQA01_00420 [Cyclobacterium qasimii]